MQNVKKVEEMSNKQPKNMNRERKLKKNCGNLTLSKFSLKFSFMVEIV